MRVKVLGLIPARGGSKGLPGKNLRLVGGIPLVGRAARTARQAGLRFGEPFRIVCSTDDPAIAEVAGEWGAETPFLRPAALASDTASSMDVVLHALDALDQQFDTVVLLQPTSPLVEPEDVLGALRLHRQCGSAVVSVTPSEHPVEWLYRMDDALRLKRAVETDSPRRRQDAVPVFRLNGAIYVSTPSLLREKRSFLTEGARGYVMPAERSVDVDTQADLDIAECLISRKQIAAIEVAGRKIGPGHPCFIIAEAGVNHNGSLEMARRLVDAAAQSGADAVKFQTFKSSKVISPVAPKADYQVQTTGGGESQLEMARRLELPFEAFRELFAYARENGIIFLSTPFDEESADFLDDLGVDAFKNGSGEITNLPFLTHVARKGKPMIVSTGMSRLSEVDTAIETVRHAGNHSVVLRHCVSNYPADPADVNLRAMTTMSAAFHVPVGYSDHTLGIEVPLAAVAMGACIVEKHFTLNRTLPGPDHRASSEPQELAALVRGIRIVEAALGHGRKEPAASEVEVAAVARRSLVAACDIPAGSVLSEDLIAVLRPGTGLPPSRKQSLIGRATRVAIRAGVLLTEEMLE